MSTSTVTLGSLVDRTLLEIQHPSEEGLRVVMGSTALSASGSTTFTLSDAEAPVNVTDLIQFGDELVLVTAKSSDAVPVYTCSRGYYSTTAATYAAGQVGIVNPKYPRIRVQEAVKRSFSRLEALGVPLITSVTLNRTSGLAYADLPADTREVLQVAYWGTNGRIKPLAGWQMFDYMPTAKWSTGKALNLPRYVTDSDDLEVTYRKPYRWSPHPNDPVSTSTIEIPEGAEELPALYASAWLAGAREFSRHEIDRSEEYSSDAADQRGSAGATVRAAWQNFYRALDEARRINHIPIHRPYIKRPKL